MIINLIEKFFSPEIILLVLAILIVSRMVNVRHVLLTLTAFLAYVMLMSQLQKTNLLAEYEGIQFLLELPLKFFEWVGNNFQSLLNDPETIGNSISSSLEDLLNSGSLEDIVKNLLAKLYSLYQEIFGVIPEGSVNTAGACQRLIPEIWMLK